MEKVYHPEEYWSKVGGRIESRDEEDNVIAGDDEPYYRYKRKEFLKLLNTVPFADKEVLEIGSGPGGNLQEILKKGPKSLTGADISNKMISLARKKLHADVNLVKVNGTKLPFENDEFDIIFTATVLQHNTDEAMLFPLIKEIARVSKRSVFFFERIENEVKGDDLCLGRPIGYYEKQMLQQGYSLKRAEFINIRVSYYVCGFIRKFLNSNTRKEGEALNSASVLLQKLALTITKKLDKIFLSKKDIALMEFTKDNIE